MEMNKIEQIKKECITLYAETKKLPSKKDMARALEWSEDLDTMNVFGDLGGNFETRHSLALKVVISYLLRKI